MSKKLSILICSLYSRAEKLNRLLAKLNPQLNAEVEVLVKSDHGEMIIGQKRNKLLSEATGEYIAFIDDDDLVSDDYVAKILSAIQTSPDCVGMQGVITFQGQCPRIFIHSTKYDSWFEQNDVYYRPPNHLNPVKRELALQVGFPELNHGEDRDYSMRLKSLLKSEKFITGVIYHYLYEKGGPPNQPQPPRRRFN